MRLFSDQQIENMLPYDGIVTYYGGVIAQAAAYGYLDRLLSTIDWKPDEAVIMGKRILTRRMVAWYGDLPYSYTYSGSTKEALAWTGDLLELRELAESVTGSKFNSCLLNLYHDG